jgi:hypothetical protein
VKTASARLPATIGWFSLTSSAPAFSPQLIDQ